MDGRRGDRERSGEIERSVDLELRGDLEQGCVRHEAMFLEASSKRSEESQAAAIRRSSFTSVHYYCILILPSFERPVIESLKCTTN